MTTGTVAPYRSATSAEHGSFWHLVHAEWTKFRTVRGWVITLIVAVLATVAVGFIGSDVHCSVGSSGAACPAPPTGPGGEAVHDAFYFAHQPVAGNGTITVQLTSLTGVMVPGHIGSTPVRTLPHLEPWAKAGVMIKESTAQGSAYAAMMVTGTHGVRMQWDYVGDTPGLAGSVSASSPRWLRLVRHGDAITGYDSADGTRWTRVGSVTLPRLTSTVQAGLFAASPVYTRQSSSGFGTGSYTGSLTMATGIFHQASLSWPATGWTGTEVGGFGPNGSGLAGKLSRSAGAVTVTGSGDIAPETGIGNVSLQHALAGTFAGLIALIVVGAMFITAEYRRGLVRVSLTASPRRGRMLAAKALVIGAVSFVTGLAATVATMIIGERTLRLGGSPLMPIPALTVVRMALGTALLLAVAAVLALAIGTAVRRSAVAITTVIVVIFIPYLFGILPNLLSLGAKDWLLRITPAAAFSLQQPFPEYSQVNPEGGYLPGSGYYPLAPWAGFAVECAWAVAALLLAIYLLRRRDA